TTQPEQHENNTIEEVEALSSIYGDEWCVIDEASRIFCIKISSDSEEPKLTACLQIILPPDYPSTSPPIYQINAAWLRGPERAKLANSLEDLYVEHAGESILYLWVEEVREFLVEKSQMSPSEKVNTTAEVEVDGDDDILDLRTLRVSPEDLSGDHADDEELPPIRHGESITDRRSTFQPHLAPVVTPRQVQIIKGELRGFQATIYREDKHSFLQDCEDDGETAAGGRLLHLLQILDVRNVMVVVSRWYGGILLGPDRFKHINNCARNILVEEGFAASTDESIKSGAKSKRPKSKKTK
uniref:RWD domain-containing protein n=1 Tax=Mola mola TaxID=94237 RepID=A0A3Q4AV63_MOLML